MSNPYETGPKVWAKIAEMTGKERNAIKAVITSMLYGGPIVHMCKEYGLEIMDVAEIRMAFDDIVSEKVTL